MKTTIDIAQSLLAEARERARAEGTTLRALVEEGLRVTLERRRVESDPRPFEMVTCGDPQGPDVWRTALEEHREESLDRLTSRLEGA